MRCATGAQGKAILTSDMGRYRVPPLMQLPALLNAADAVQGNTETADDLKLLLNEGSPLGGARPKSAVVDQDGTLAIAKFPKPDDDRSIPHGEVLALALAGRAGMNVAHGRIETVAGRPVALIRRFDRNGETPHTVSVGGEPPGAQRRGRSDLYRHCRMHSHVFERAD